MKIIIPILGKFGNSGGFRVLSKLANYWIASGNEVSFLVYVNSEPPYFPTIANILYYNKKGNLVGKDQKDASPPLLRMFQMRIAMQNALDNCSADVVLANHCLTALPVKKSIIKAKKFYYVQAYEPEYYYRKTLKDFIFKKISKNSYNLGLDIIVNADMYKNYANLHSTKVVYPGIDLDVFCPKPLKKRNSQKIIIGTIGRLEEYKGTAYVIKAFQLLRHKLGECVELHVAFGDKVMESIDGVKVFFPNGDHNLADYYRSLDIYVCAGTVQLEAIHYPVLESMACKIPVITTGYYPASKNNAEIVPIKNAEAIKQKLLEIISHRDDVKINRAFEDVKQFEWKYIANKMLNYFKN